MYLCTWSFAFTRRNQNISIIIFITKTKFASTRRYRYQLFLYIVISLVFRTFDLIFKTIIQLSNNIFHPPYFYHWTHRYFCSFLLTVADNFITINFWARDKILVFFMGLYSSTKEVLIINTCLNHITFHFVCFYVGIFL